MKDKTQKPEISPIEALKEALNRVSQLWENAHDGWQSEEIAECDCDLCEAANLLDLALKELSK
tara:strand:- start:1022 stop:1210 length:189 start_codon:yes stop_codon:yes gene_type:complete